MAKSKEPPELPLPPNFGKGGDNVLPFGKRRVPPIKGLIPDPSHPPSMAPMGPNIHSYHLTDEELIELQSYLQGKPRLEQLKVPSEAVGSGPPLDDSPLAMLKDLVHQIEAGNIHPVGAFLATVEYAADGTEYYPFYVSQLNRLSVLGMLHELLEDLP
jgi:hypothetical protein